MSNLNVQTPPKSYEFLTSGTPRTEGETPWQYNLRKLLTIKSIKSLEADQKKSTLNRCLGPLDLTMVGIGGTIGAGIFVLTGELKASTILFHRCNVGRGQSTQANAIIYISLF